MSKNRGQSLERSLKRGNIDYRGVSLKRPFNNSKRTAGRQDQVKAERLYFYLKERFKYLKRKAREEEHEKLVEEQIKKLDEGISNN